MIHFPHMGRQEDRRVRSEERLTRAARQLDRDYRDAVSTKKRLWRNFIDGVVRGLGIAIGGTIVFAVVGYFLSRFLLIPGVETWIRTIEEQASTLRDFTEGEQQ